MKTKNLAVWVDCAGLAEGKYNHAMRDGCWSCAPWWERLPTCPFCRCKLHKLGRVKCKNKNCRAWCFVAPEIRERDPDEFFNGC